MKMGLLLSSLIISFFMVSANAACSSDDDQASSSKTRFIGNNGSQIHFTTYKPDVNYAAQTDKKSKKKPSQPKQCKYT